MNFKRHKRQKRKGLSGYWLPKRFRSKDDRKMNSKQHVQKIVISSNGRTGF